MRRRDRTGLDQAEPEPRRTDGLFANQSEKTNEVERAERLDDEGGGSDSAREGAVLRIVTRSEEDHADRLCLTRRLQLATDRETIASVSREVHVEQDDFWSVLSRHGQAFVGGRRFQDRPTLSRQRHASDGA